MHDIAAAKRALRAQARVRRAEAHAARRDHAAKAVCARVLALRPDWRGRVVAVYWPMRDELDVRPLIDALVQAGAVAALPAIVARDWPLACRRFAPGDALVPGAFGTHEPPAEAPEVAPEVLVVPLLGFDRAGYRLGYGGGYYDRTLAALRAADARVKAVGAAYGEQEFAAIPHHDGDQRLDLIVTDREAIAP
jgi:5-formyltetrahydrofolate cyclo-ligase